MQTEVKAVPPSIPAGKVFGSRMRNWRKYQWGERLAGLERMRTFGTTSLNQASSFSSSANHSPVAVPTSFSLRYIWQSVSLASAQLRGISHLHSSRFDSILRHISSFGRAPW